MTSTAPPSTNPSLIFRLTRAPQDSVTWEQFVFLYGPALLDWCCKNGVQEADAQDISQEVLLQISRQIQRLVYDPQLSFRGWLRAVVHGAWCDWVKEQSSPKRQMHGVSNSLDSLNHIEARDDLIARLESQYDRELFELAARAVRKLVEPQTWQAFEWQAMNGLSPADVGERLGIKAASALASRYRVTNLLRVQIARLEKDS
jgi:RNA polymerase sigma-70 factor (ECF subfamily)